MANAFWLFLAAHLSKVLKDFIVCPFYENKSVLFHGVCCHDARPFNLLQYSLNDDTGASAVHSGIPQDTYAGP